MRAAVFAAFVLFGSFLGVEAGYAQTQANAFAAPTARPWITAYYPEWEAKNLPPGEIPFADLTHLVHFSVLPKPDGTLDWSTHLLDASAIKATVQAAHGAHKPVLLCAGGADTAPGFRSAFQPAVRPAFVARLAEAVTANGYDGLDLDMEPVEAADETLYAAFVHEIRAELRRRDPRLLLTAAVGGSPGLFARLQGEFDQINLMTYDQSGPWEGWVTWHNSALANSVLRFPRSDRLRPSVEGTVRTFLAAGITPSKLGIGLPFYGCLWSGASAPGQDVAGVTAREIGYRDLARTLFRPERFHWDEAASVPYLSVEAVDGKPPAFVSYDDERSLRLKVEYLRRAKLGGAIIWQLGEGHRAELSPGQRDPLLRAVGAAASQP